MANLLFWSIVSIVIPFLTVLIGIIVIRKIQKELKSGFPSGDEWTQKITSKAEIFVLLIGNYFTIVPMLMLIFGRELDNLQKVDAGYLLLSYLLFSSVSFLSARN